MLPATSCWGGHCSRQPAPAKVPSSSPISDAKDAKQKPIRGTGNRAMWCFQPQEVAGSMCCAAHSARAETCLQGRAGPLVLLPPLPLTRPAPQRAHWREGPAVQIPAASAPPASLRPHAARGPPSCSNGPAMHKALLSAAAAVAGVVQSAPRVDPHPEQQQPPALLAGQVCQLRIGVLCRRTPVMASQRHAAEHTRGRMVLPLDELEMPHLLYVVSSWQSSACLFSLHTCTIAAPEHWPYSLTN